MNTIDKYTDPITFIKIVDRTIDEYIDDEITFIGVNAFYDCSSLATVDLPEATSIGDSAFSSCSSLTTVILRNTEQVVTLSNKNAFSGAENAIFYVPDSLVDSYKAANNWSTYADRIKGLSELPAA
jgi:hypothetical protein